jgi:hypothetical protein
MDITDIVNDVGVCKGRLWFREIVEGGRYDGDSFRERVLILLD